MMRRLVALVLLVFPGCGAQRHYADEPAPQVTCTEPTGPLLSNVSSVYAGSAMTCAIVSGRVARWDVNDRGRLGDGFDNVRRDRPVFVTGVEHIADITQGNGATFARSSDGTIFVWGSNRSGEFGDGSPDFHIAWTPRHIPEWGAVQQIRGGIPTCALRQDGSIAIQLIQDGSSGSSSRNRANSGIPSRQVQRNFSSPDALPPLHKP